MKKYEITGIVVHGKQLGRTVGMPTINLETKQDISDVPSGVYASTATIQGEQYMGLTSIGRRPSVDTDKHRTIETHLLDFSKDVYGEKVELTLHTFIREIRKFSGIEEVKKQVEEDIKKINVSL